jgi:hypothetical protein
MSTVDKYEDQRFRSACPTCGQNFLVERVDLLTAALQRAVDEAVADDLDDWYANACEVLAKVGAA